MMNVRTTGASLLNFTAGDVVPTASGPLSSADTLDAAPSALSSSSDVRSRPVGFIEGDDAHISRETTDILRGRLRSAAGILGLAFGLFFVYRLITGDGPGRSDEFSFYFHGSVAAALITACVLLCRRCEISLGKLRVFELVIFGLPVAYFLLYDFKLLTAFASRHYIPNPMAYWMGIIFIYAIFIPNSWRRAAVVIGAMSVAPAALIAYLWLTNRDFAAIIGEGPGFIVEVSILLGVTYLSATYGTHVINSLRNEAFEARQFGQYRLCHPIGSGGMGDVYLAEHRMMKRRCAIKLIRPGKAGDPQVLARFEREVRATAKLSHWNTIEIFDYGRTEDGTFYYVMEYLPGLSLNDLVERHGPLPPARAIHLLVQTCDALSEAHGRGLIHRDIKPGNVFSAQRGGYYDVAKLLDFGLAKPITSDQVPVRLTQDGAITGSPLFMSPEQALGDSEPDARSDVYSLGALAYFLLTGAPPFVGEKPIKIILAHAHEAVVAPSRLRSEIPLDLEKVVLRCLAKNPNDRYQSALELRQALGDCVAAGGWSHEDAARWWQANGSSDIQNESLVAAI
jgi:eukaryotic-like serine/threonine-protein kinase